MLQSINRYVMYTITQSSNSCFWIILKSPISIKTLRQKIFSTYISSFKAQITWDSIKLNKVITFCRWWNSFRDVTWLAQVEIFMSSLGLETQISSSYSTTGYYLRGANPYSMFLIQFFSLYQVKALTHPSYEQLQSNKKMLLV